MPELPEVETMCRMVAPVIGAAIVHARRCPCRKKPIHIRPRIDRLHRAVQGRQISGVSRLGKRVVVEIQPDLRLVIEPRMSGLVLLENPPTQEHLRFCLELSGAAPARLLFWDRRGLGTVQLVGERQLRRLIESRRLGPDALCIDADQLQQRMRNKRAAIKPALMDQRVLAGVGNIYASEILHRAGVDPRARCDRLAKKQWARIHHSMVQILQAAIRSEGSTLADGTYRAVLGQPGRFQLQHRVYDRAGQWCLGCGKSKIRRLVQSQRATFYCAHCQRKTLAAAGGQ